MKKIFIVLMLTMIFLAAPVFAQRPITVRLASPVPENTPWGNFLNQVAADWRRITNGQVDVIIFHNGTAGSEAAVLRNLRLNQLQAAVLSTFGLIEVIPEIMAISCPFFIRNDEELDLVLGEIRGELEDRISAMGFHTLAWARVGWIRFFSKAPVFVPDDLKRMRLGTLAEFEKLNQVFSALGFQMVPIPQGETLIALNSPMVDAVYQSPVAIGGTQLFALARNMASINVAPFMGAIIMNRRTWNSIPERFRPQMIEAVRRREAELDLAVRRFEENMIRTMGEFGLVVNQLTPEQEQLWYDEFERAIPNLVGAIFDRNIYNRIDAILRQHRSRQR